MDIGSPNYVLEFMKEMQKPLTSSKIQNSAYMLQTKGQGFPKGTYNFKYRSPLIFMNSPMLTLEISGLGKEGHITESIQREQRLFNINPKYNLSQNTFDKRYINFIKNHLDNIEPISLMTFLKNEKPGSIEKYLINKASSLTKIEDEKSLNDAAIASQLFWNL